MYTLHQEGRSGLVKNTGHSGEHWISKMTNSLSFPTPVYICCVAAVAVLLITTATVTRNRNHCGDADCGHGHGQQSGRFIRKRESNWTLSGQSSTDGIRRLPQAIIVGVKKAGTRALLEYLRLHPSVRAPGPEIHFFDRNYHRGLNWYRDQMPLTSAGQLTMEKTPGYFIRREVPARIYKMSPNTKILVVVRNPVTRAISDYTQSRTKNRTYKQFEELAFLDSNGSRGVVDVSWSAIRIGFYYKHMQKWLRYFPLHQIHFVSGERLITAPSDELKLVEAFLHLSPYVKEEHFYYNVSKGFPCVKKRQTGGYRCLGKTKGRTHPHLSQQTLHTLADFYQPFNQVFFNLSKRNFGWNENDETVR